MPKLSAILAQKADLVDGKVRTEQLPISNNGLSAYDLAIQDGFSGTLEEWLLSLKGDRGERGPQGEQGIQGFPGSDATVTKSAVEAVLTGEVESHSHASSGGLTQAQILARQL